jgi:gamma-glutamylcyclotransferase (GGCT)/AIG2-like uncharacterized protein YtfP
MVQRAWFSPDIKELQKHEGHIVFICDAFMKECNSNVMGGLLKSAKYLGQSATLEAKYVLKRTSTLALPFECRNTKVPGAANILGEAYWVTTEDLLSLDVIYDNNDKQTRKKVFTSLIEQTTPFKQGAKRPVVGAWIYFGNEAKWENLPLVFAGKLRHRSQFMWKWNPKAPIGL